MVCTPHTGMSSYVHSFSTASTVQDRRVHEGMKEHWINPSCMPVDEAGLLLGGRWVDVGPVYLQASAENDGGDHDPALSLAGEKVLQRVGWSRAELIQGDKQLIVRGVASMESPNKQHAEAQEFGMAVVLQVTSCLYKLKDVLVERNGNHCVKRNSVDGIGSYHIRPHCFVSALIQQ